MWELSNAFRFIATEMMERDFEYYQKLCEECKDTITKPLNQHDYEKNKNHLFLQLVYKYNNEDLYAE